jgi:hypothetical protein
VRSAGVFCSNMQSDADRALPRQCLRLFLPASAACRGTHRACSSRLRPVWPPALVQLSPFALCVVENDADGERPRAGSTSTGLQREFEQAARSPASDQDEAEGAGAAKARAPEDTWCPLAPRLGAGGRLRVMQGLGEGESQESQGRRGRGLEEAEECAAEECHPLPLSRRQKRWRAEASQIDGKDAGAGSSERKGKRCKRDADVPCRTDRREVYESGGGSGHLQLSGGECEVYTMHSTLCPSDCGDEDLDCDDSGAWRECMEGGRCSNDESRCSFDVFESFWSRVAIVPTTAPVHAGDAACARGIKEGQAALLARTAEKNTSEGYPNAMDTTASEQTLILDASLLPRLAPMVWEKGLLPDEAEKQSTAEHCPAHTLAAQEANRGVALATGFRPWAPKDEQTSGCEWEGFATHDTTAPCRWLWLLRENEEVMEALVLGQRVLRVLSADRGLSIIAARGSCCPVGHVCAARAYENGGYDPLC